METNMKESLKMAAGMVKVRKKWFSLWFLGSNIVYDFKVSGLGIMETYMKESGNMTKSMAKVRKNLKEEKISIVELKEILLKKKIFQKDSD